MFLFTLICHLVVAMKRAPEGEVSSETVAKKARTEIVIGGNKKDVEELDTDFAALLAELDQKYGNHIYCDPGPFQQQVNSIITTEPWDGDEARWLLLHCRDELERSHDNSQMNSKAHELIDVASSHGDFRILQVALDFGGSLLKNRVVQPYVQMYGFEHVIRASPDLRSAIAMVKDQPLSLELLSDLQHFMTNYPPSQPYLRYRCEPNHSNAVYKVALLCHFELNEVGAVVQRFAPCFGRRFEHTRVFLEVCAKRGINPIEYLPDQELKAVVSMCQSDFAPTDPVILNAAFRYMARAEVLSFIQFYYMKLAMKHNSEWARERLNTLGWLLYLDFFPSDLHLVPLPDQFPTTELREMVKGDFLEGVTDLRTFVRALDQKYPHHYREIRDWARSIFTREELHERGVLPKFVPTPHHESHPKSEMVKGDVFAHGKPTPGENI